MANANFTSIHSIITRKEAKALGLLRYFTGKSCPKDHISERFTSYGQCCECLVKSRDQWYANNIDRARKKNIEWNLKNPNSKNKRNAEWRARNPEQAKASVKAHYIANPEMYAVYRANRRAAKRNAPGNGITKYEIKWLIFLQGARCVYCMKQKPMTLDHIIPLSKGGAHDVTNAQMVCKSCNSSKCAKDPLVFANTLGLLF
jgi:5-methylcytosine-specific restriction endonuclease McrA